MPTTIETALLFLINTIFDLYLFILIIRLILVYVGADYFNPLVQFIVKMTNFLVKPLRRLIPNVNRFEVSTFLLIVAFEIIKYLFILLLTFGTPKIMGLFILVIGDMLRLAIQTFFYAIILQAILSFVQPRSPINFALYRLTSPIMRPFQRLIPPISGIDLSPIPALIVLQLLQILLVAPIITLGFQSAYSAI